MEWPFRRRDKRLPTVLFRSPWQRADDGWSIAGRRYARMMQMAGLDMRIWTWKPEPVTDQSIFDEFDYFSSRIVPPKWDLYLFSSAVRDWECTSHVFEHIMESDGARAMHVVLERQQIEPEMAEALNRLDGVWAQCGANEEVLEAAGVRNVTLHLHPYFDDDPWLDIPPPTEHRRFLWVGRNEPRKAPDNLVRAFMRAFAPGEAELTLKLSQWSGPALKTNATIEEVVEDQILMNRSDARWRMDNWRDSIRIVDKALPKDELVKLFAEHDVYCSAARGEGLDLPAYQSKMAGRTLCLTDSGGPRDFVGDGDELVESIGSMPSSYEYYWSQAPYADYEVDDLARAMHRIRRRAPRGERLPGKFRAEKVAKGFGKWVRRMVR